MASAQIVDKPSMNCEDRAIFPDAPVDSRSAPNTISNNSSPPSLSSYCGNGEIGVAVIERLGRVHCPSIHRVISLSFET